MEGFLVYGLVILFFLLLVVFVGTVLRTHPYSEPERRAAAPASNAAARTDSKVAYAVLAGMFLLFCLLTAMNRRRQPAY
jgi:hypothetical protein